jgi:probable F420-dependent oxidoreductase
MKFAAIFPQLEIGNDPAIIREYAQTAEELGYDSLVAYDHVLGANKGDPNWQGRYSHEDAFHEPFVLFGYLAAITQRIEFATGILILPQRPAALVAKQAAQLDVLSNGRFRLGVGIGWNQMEYEALGYDFRNRARRMEEQIALMRELWTKPLVTFKGDFHTVTDAGLKPMPIQQPIPVWFGGGTKEAVMRRIARLADGWIMHSYSVEEGKPTIERLHQYLNDAGRDPKTFGLDVRVDLHKSPPETWLEHMRGWRDLGATHISFNSMDAGLKSPADHIAAIRQFKEIADQL